MFKSYRQIVVIKEILIKGFSVHFYNMTGIWVNPQEVYLILLYTSAVPTPAHTYNHTNMRTKH